MYKITLYFWVQHIIDNMANKKGKVTTQSFWYGTPSQRLIELQYFSDATADISDDCLAYWYYDN